MQVSLLAVEIQIRTELLKAELERSMTDYSIPNPYLQDKKEGWSRAGRSADSHHEKLAQLA